MKKLSFLPLLALILLMGCSKQNAELNPSAQDEQLSLRGKYVPFKATLSSDVTGGLGNKCPDLVGVINPIVEWKGKASHMGKVSAISDHCFYQSISATPFQVTDGEATIEAANGDLLKLVYEGSWHPNPPDNQLVLDLTFTIQGGSGRFSNAKGSGKINQTITFPSWPPFPGAQGVARAVYTGKIAY